MLRITGKLIAKSLLLEGNNNYGKWQLVQIIIEKQINRKKKKIVFTCFGNVANTANDIIINQRITILFEPACNYNEKYNRWFTELKAKQIELYVKKPKWNGNTIEPETPPPAKDNQLF